jgi:hypothetical protein
MAVERMNRRRLSCKKHVECSLLSSQWGSFVTNRTALICRLTVDALGTLSCKPSSYRKRVRKVINKVKW